MSTTRYDSIWHQPKPSNQPKPRPELRRDGHRDVVVIGAGITGLTCAYFLAKAGKRVAVLEAHSIGAGTSGYTSAHLSTDWDGEYSQIASNISKETARLVARAMQSSIDIIEEIGQNSFEGNGFERVPGYLYDETGDHRKELESSYEAAREAGLNVKWDSNAGLPFAIHRAMRVEDQGIFHPVRHLQCLASAIESMGGAIYENSRVVDYSNSSPFSVETEHAKLKADHLVIATHVPLGKSLLHSMVTPFRSYLATIEWPKEFPNALYWDMEEPYNYTRPFQAPDGKQYLLIGGKDRKVAHGDERTSFAQLNSYVQKHFGPVEIIQEWSAQLYEPTDHLPMIGQAPVINEILLATGLSGDGLTMGTFAGWELSEQAQGRTTEWTDAFSPRRFLKSGYKEFVSENWDIAKSFVADRLHVAEDEELHQLQPGEGVIIGPRRSPQAVYRADDGDLHYMSAVCPHMGCVVRWNSTQKSFDCPCHGSRFGSTGEILEGPSLSSLESKRRGDSSDRPPAPLPSPSPLA